MPRNRAGKNHRESRKIKTQSLGCGLSPTVLNELRSQMVDLGLDGMAAAVHSVVRRVQDEGLDFARGLEELLKLESRFQKSAGEKRLSESLRKVFAMRDPWPDPEFRPSLVGQVQSALSRERVALYARSATSYGTVENPALERQVERIKQHFPNACFKRIPVFADSGVGGLAGPKPALEDLCKEVRARKYEFVLAADPERYSRDFEESLKLRDFGLAHGCEFLSLPDVFRQIRR